MLNNIRAEIHKFLVKIANREDPDQTASLLLQKQSDLGLRCLSVAYSRQLLLQKQSDPGLRCLSVAYSKQLSSEAV